MMNWIKTRMKERTSWDGAMCIALGLMILFMAPLAKIAVVLRLRGVFGLFGNQNKLGKNNGEEKKNGIVVKDDHNEFELMLRFFGNEILAIKLSASTLMVN